MATPNQQAFAPNRLSKQIVAPSDTTQPPSEDTGAQQLAAAVDDLIDQLQGKFDTVSKEIFGKCQLIAPPCFLGYLMHGHS
jgi:hypothetical protein